MRYDAKFGRSMSQDVDIIRRYLKLNGAGAPPPLARNVPDILYTPLPTWVTVLSLIALGQTIRSKTSNRHKLGSLRLTFRGHSRSSKLTQIGTGT